MVTLYQFPISHFCEKARWALDYKGVRYRERNLLPGFHTRVVRRLAPRTSVPVLVHDGRAIQNSADILTYLDQTFANRPLTPADEAEATEAQEWEAYLDREVGIHVRRLCYHTLLDHPDLTIPMLTTRGPWYGPMLIKLIYPKLTDTMRRLMEINDQTARESEERVQAAIDRIHDRLQGRDYLVGDAFSRADLAAAALLAPLCRPHGYGIDWPDTLPDPLGGIAAAWAPKLAWVGGCYQQYRHPAE